MQHYLCTRNDKSVANGSIVKTGGNMVAGWNFHDNYTGIAWRNYPFDRFGPVYYRMEADHGRIAADASEGLEHCI